MPAASTTEMATSPASASRAPVLGGVDTGSAGLPAGLSSGLRIRGLRARRFRVRGRRSRRARERRGLRSRRGRRGATVPATSAAPGPAAVSARVGCPGAPAASLGRNRSDLRWLADTHGPGAVAPLSLSEVSWWRWLESLRLGAPRWPRLSCMLAASVTSIST